MSKRKSVFLTAKLKKMQDLSFEDKVEKAATKIQLHFGILSAKLTRTKLAERRSETDAK